MEINNILYKYLRGSWCHGIAIEGKSDYDYGGVYYCNINDLLGVRSNYNEQISDSKSDEVYYEIGRWFELLLKSNATVLESLFVDKEFIIGEIHPIIQKIIDNREMFLSKDAFKPLLGYSFEQIKKARGYNKKCNYPEDMERKGVLDFCYVSYGQGSRKVRDWLHDHGLFQQYCGLVALSNMRDNYGLYYDWGAHIICEYGVDFSNKTTLHEAWDKICAEMDNWDNEKAQSFGDTLTELVFHDSYRTYFEQFSEIMPYGFTGIVNRNEDSNEVRVCTVPKNIMPIISMAYNKDGYESYCRDYKNWTEWKKNRNPIRFADNKGYNFDAKNMCETVRLIHTGIELAKGEGFNVKRTWDRDFLLNIKNHKMSYDEIINYVNDKRIEFEEAVKSCKLPESIDYNKVNNLLIDCRKELYNI